MKEPSSEPKDRPFARLRLSEAWISRLAVAWIIAERALDLMGYTNPVLGRIMLAGIPMWIGGWVWAALPAWRSRILVRSGAVLVFAAYILISGAWIWAGRNVETPDERSARHQRLLDLVIESPREVPYPPLIEALEELRRDSVSMQNLDLRSRHLNDVQLNGANLEQAHFDSAQLAGAVFSDAGLYFATFTRAEAPRIRFDSAMLLGVSLVGAQAVQGDFRHSLSRAAFLNGAEIQNAKFDSALVQNTNLNDAHLEFSSFRGAYLSYSDFEGVNLTLADLRGAVLRDIENWHLAASYAGANIAGIRVAPEGFREHALARNAVEISTTAEWERFRESMRGQVSRTRTPTGSPQDRYRVQPDCRLLEGLEDASRESGCRNNIPGRPWEPREFFEPW